MAASDSVLVAIRVLPGKNSNSSAEYPFKELHNLSKATQGLELRRVGKGNEAIEMGEDMMMWGREDTLQMREREKERYFVEPFKGSSDAMYDDPQVQPLL